MRWTLLKSEFRQGALARIPNPPRGKPIRLPVTVPLAKIFARFAAPLFSNRAPPSPRRNWQSWIRFLDPAFAPLPAQPQGLSGILSRPPLGTQSGFAPIVRFHRRANVTLGMKNKVHAMLLGLTFSLASAGVSHAMSELISLSTEPLWPTSSTPDNNLVYNVTTVGRSGAGLLEVTLAAGAMPPGVTVTFSPSVLRFTGNQLFPAQWDPKLGIHVT